MKKSEKRKKNKALTIHHSPFTTREGQTLIEALGAISLMLLIVTALVGLGIRAVRSATAARNLATASSYAQEGMEVLRSIRDRSFGELTACSANPSRIVWNTTDSRWDCQTGTESLGEIYTRSFVLTTISATKVQADIDVEWQDRGVTHNVTVTSYFTDWR